MTNANARSPWSEGDCHVTEFWAVLVACVRQSVSGEGRLGPGCDLCNPTAAAVCPPRLAGCDDYTWRGHFCYCIYSIWKRAVINHTHDALFSLHVCITRPKAVQRTQCGLLRVGDDLNDDSMQFGLRNFAFVIQYGVEGWYLIIVSSFCPEYTR